MACNDRFETYKLEHAHSIMDPDEYWNEKAQKLLHWNAPYTSTKRGGFETGDVNWFAGGKLNACYNCVDRHVPTKGKQVMLVFSQYSWIVWW